MRSAFSMAAASPVSRPVVPPPPAPPPGAGGGGGGPARGVAILPFLFSFPSVVVVVVVVAVVVVVGPRIEVLLHVSLQGRLIIITPPQQQRDSVCVCVSVCKDKKCAYESEWVFGIYESVKRVMCV